MLTDERAKQLAGELSQIAWARKLFLSGPVGKWLDTENEAEGAQQDVSSSKREGLPR